MSLRLPHRDERGSSSIQFVIVFPAVLLIIMAGIQIGLYATAQSIAQAAAEEGARAAAAQNATAATGQATATEFAARTGSNGLLANPHVTSTRTTTTVTVTVTGQAMSLVPIPGGWSVTHTANYPVERVTRP